MMNIDTETKKAFMQYLMENQGMTLSTAYGYINTISNEKKERTHYKSAIQHFVNFQNFQKHDSTEKQELFGAILGSDLPNDIKLKIIKIIEK